MTWLRQRLRLRRWQWVSATVVAGLGVVVSGSGFAAASDSAAREVVAEQPLVFVAMGDFGTGGRRQMQVAEAMASVCDEVGCDFVLGLGDNIYSDGVDDVDDSQFKTKFEEPYEDVDLPFHLSLGNHDHRGNVDAQIAYSERSSKWNLPARYYSFEYPLESGYTVQFVALDTNPMRRSRRERRRQETWLVEQLEQSTAKWKFVFGHHPWRSNGRHGDADDELDEFYRDTLCGRADVLLSGHDHHKEHLEPECDVALVVSGSAAKRRSVDDGDNTVWARSSYGFALIKVFSTQIDLAFYDRDGDLEYEAVLAIEVE